MFEFLLAEGVTFTTEGMVVIGGLVTTLIGTITYLFRLMIANRDAELARALAEHEKIRAASEEQIKSWRSIAIEATNRLATEAETYRRTIGKRFVVPIADVVAEHSSPATEVQKDTAELATARAKLVASALVFDDKNLAEPATPDKIVEAGIIAGDAADASGQLADGELDVKSKEHK